MNRLRMASAALFLLPIPAFAGSLHDAREIHLADVRQLTFGGENVEAYWSFDGRRILFSSSYGDPRGHELDLWAIDVDGTDLERAADRFAADAAWLADDAREGRGIGLPGLAEAGAWIEARFREIGLLPAGEDGGYRQGFEVEVSVESGAGTSLVIDGEAMATDAFRPTAFSTAGPVAAEVVYAGWGITAPEPGRDDYEGLDVRGKIALVRRFVPPGEAFQGTDNERRWGDLRYKAFNAREHGAIGLLVADLAPAEPFGDPHAGGEAPLPKLRPERSGDAGIPVAVLTRAAAEPLLGGGRRARLAVDLRRESAPAFNVVGRLVPPGAAAGEPAVLVGAHYDHLGRGGPDSLAPGSTEIHNGADDNASGVAALLEVARALAARREDLRRPVVFAAFSGEELGLLGSSELVNSPPPGLEPARLVAMMNLDMVGRLRDERLTVFGVDTAAEWDELVTAACAGAGIECEQRGDSYGPSDHTAFYAVGVPVLYFFTGTHEQYHRPSDDAHRLNATGGAKVAALVAELVRAVSERDERLAVVKAAAPPFGRGDAPELRRPAQRPVMRTSPEPVSMTPSPEPPASSAR